MNLEHLQAKQQKFQRAAETGRLSRMLLVSRHLAFEALILMASGQTDEALFVHRCSRFANEAAADLTYGLELKPSWTLDR